MFFRSLKGEKSRDEDNDDFRQCSKGEDDFIVDMDTGAVGEGRNHFRKQAVSQYADDDHGDENQVVAPFDADRFFMTFFLHVHRGTAGSDFFLVVMMVDEAEYGKEKNQVKHQDGQQVERPGKGNAALETHEQGRIAKGCETAAHIDDEEDEEDHHVDFLLAPGIGPDERTDHQHGSSGRPNPAGKCRADEQQQSIDFCRAGQSTFNDDATSGDKETVEQNDEWDVVQQYRFEETKGPFTGTVGCGKGNEEDEPTAERDPLHILFPPFTFKKRDDSNRQEHADEGDDAPNGQ